MAILDGRHALETGGGRGIGRAIAASLSGAGATVTVLGRQEAALKDAQKKRIEKYARIIALDLPTIELAGGSARCMMATIHLPPA